MAQKKIVVFADGTGNAFTTQESNVWRLYQALDQSAPDQIARYIPGVGTSGVKLFALLDGATGIGVPSNVRKLYRFLCWNWNEGDEIYMFGFSRGAFTIRTLIGLIDSQGLVPREIDGERVSHADMERNAMAAWRTYRKSSSGFVLPTIWLTRLVRDLLLAIYHRVMRHPPYKDVRTHIDQRRKDVRIRFAGLFDTVEAYGVPIEELRRAIDVTLWPISFSNHRLSSRVDTARHALALDDERTSFHPLRFDLSAEEQDQSRADYNRIKEVWFAGVHSDIGGGYPDNALANVPLVWIGDEAALGGKGLRFTQDAIKRLRDDASAFGPMHDSRAGLAVLYRYHPRPIAADERGDPPVIHHSVVEKMVYGTEGYAPITLPETAAALMPDGTTRSIKGFKDTDVEAAARQMREVGIPPQLQALNAVASLQPPDQAFVEHTRDTVWWRRMAYFALLAATVLTVSLPWTVAGIVRGFERLCAGLAQTLGWQRQWMEFWGWAVGADKGVATNLDSVSRTVGGFLPSYLTDWLDAIVAYPFACGTVLALTLLLYRTNASLREKIIDRARRAWFPPAGAAVTPPKAGVLLRIARCARRSWLSGWVDGLMSRLVWPAIGAAAILCLVLVTVSRTTVGYRSGNGTFCDSKAGQRTSDFAIDRLCWASGIQVEKGRRYTIWIQMAEDAPFLDRGIMTDVAGFSDGGIRHLLALPIRRWWSAAWFQPIARVNTAGNTEWPLQALDGTEAPELIEHAVVAESDGSLCKKLDGKGLATTLVARKQETKLRTTFVSQFVAPASGELFLYLNDAIAAIPFGPTTTCFYDNNFGRAKVIVQPVPLPPMDGPVPPTAALHRGW